MTVFLFSDESLPLAGGDVLVRIVPPGIADKTSLLAWYSQSLDFPAWFGGNWDALSDCLSDLSWIAHSEIMIMHSDLPLETGSAEQRIYLDILVDTVRSWRQDGQRQFKVLFPARFGGTLHTMG